MKQKTSIALIDAIVGRINCGRTNVHSNSWCDDLRQRREVREAHEGQSSVVPLLFFFAIFADFATFAIIAMGGSAFTDHA